MCGCAERVDMEVGELNRLGIDAAKEDLKQARGRIFRLDGGFEREGDAFPFLGEKDIALEVALPVVVARFVLDEQAACAVGVLGGEGAGVEGDHAGFAFFPLVVLVEFNADGPGAGPWFFDIERDGFFERLAFDVDRGDGHGIGWDAIGHAVAALDELCAVVEVFDGRWAGQRRGKKYDGRDESEDGGVHGACVGFGAGRYHRFGCSI